VEKSSFQGSLYLSRESLGNHFFEGFQKSRAVDVGVYRKHAFPISVKMLILELRALRAPGCSRRLKIG
jgi:hypothetical protein